MARKQYRIDEFVGINQSRDENALSSSYSTDACNIDTSSGNLTVAKGYVKHIQSPVIGNDYIYRMTTFKKDGQEQVLVLTDKSVYASRGATWSKVFDYGNIGLAYPRFDFTQAKIGSVDYLLIGCGERPIVKYDGETASLFGSSALLSDESVLYLDMYKSRLFSAGAPLHRNRLYWSQLPGGSRTIENWGPADDSVNVEGGHTEIGSTDNDPITGLYALSNQLLIFKQNSLYRLIGDKPSNFIIERIDSIFNSPSHTAIVPYGDSLLFLTSDGLYAFNGVTVRPLTDAKYIQDILKNFSVEDSCGAYCKGKFYFTLREGLIVNALLEYDPMRHAYMIRRGFTIEDIHANTNSIYMVNGLRYIYRLNEGSTYDGTPIMAWWKTPSTDLLDKSSVKALRSLELRGSSDTNSRLIVDVCAGRHCATHDILLPELETDVVEVPLQNEGRTFSLKFYNESGGTFSIKSGIELLFEQWRRVE